MTPSDNDYNTGVNNPHGNYREGSSAWHGKLYREKIGIINDIAYKPPKTPPSGLRNIRFSGNFRLGGGELTPLQYLLLGVTLGGPIAVGVQTNSWLWGAGSFALIGFLCAQADDLLKTDVGQVVESIFNWSLGMSFLTIVAFIYEFSQWPSMSVAAILSAGATVVVVIVQIVYRRWAAAARAASHRRSDD